MADSTLIMSQQGSFSPKRRRDFLLLGWPDDTEPAEAILDGPSMALGNFELLLDDRILRNKLITALSKQTPNPSSLLRLCIAIDEYQKIKDKTEKRGKGRKIVAMFLQTGSMFEIPQEMIPESIRRAIMTEHFDSLRALRTHLVARLCTDSAVRNAMRDLEA